MITPFVMGLVWLGHVSVACAIPWLAFQSSMQSAGADWQVKIISEERR